MRKYYFAASDNEGCGHKHSTYKEAAKCVPLIETRGSTRGVYKMELDEDGHLLRKTYWPEGEKNNA